MKETTRWVVTFMASTPSATAQAAALNIQTRHGAVLRKTSFPEGNARMATVTSDIGIRLGNTAP